MENTKVTPASLVTEYLGVTRSAEEASHFEFKIPTETVGFGFDARETIHHDQMELVGLVNGKMEGKHECVTWVNIPLKPKTDNLEFSFNVGNEGFGPGMVTKQCKQPPIAVDINKYRIALGALKKAGYRNVADANLDKDQTAEAGKLAARIREVDSKSITVGDKMQMEFKHKEKPYAFKGTIEEIKQQWNGRSHDTVYYLLLDNGESVKVEPAFADTLKMTNLSSYGSAYLDTFKEVPK